MTYLIIFIVATILSALFAMGGVGSAIALVPTLGFLEVPLNLAKAIGLFVNTSTTITASYLNFKRKVLDFKFTIPLIIASFIASPIGARSSIYFDEKVVKIILIIFLIVSGYLLIFYKRKIGQKKYEQKWILYLSGAVVGFFSGMLGIGGGSFLAPVLIFLGYDVKKVAVALSFIIPFSTLAAFLSYLSFVHIDWILLGLTAVAAIFGGIIGNQIMHTKMDPRQVKKLLGMILWLLAGSLIWKMI